MGLFKYFGKKKGKKKLNMSGIKPELRKDIDQEVLDLQKEREKMNKAVEVAPETGDRKYWGDFKKALKDSARKKKKQ